jgi:hypothetical protein
MAPVLVNLLLAGYMAGVGWLVERVVYPQFTGVPAERWAAHHDAHSRRITPVVAPPLLAQPVVALALLIDRPDGVAGAALVGNLVLPAVVLLATGAVFAPLHARLGAGPPPEALLRRLRRLNALRTAAWSLHAALAMGIALAAT